MARRASGATIGPIMFAHRSSRLVALSALLFVLGAPMLLGARASDRSVVAVTLGKPSEFAIKLSKTKALPTHVTFQVRNGGALAHGFKVCTVPLEGRLANACTGKATKTLAPGASSALAVVFPQSGTYEFLSNVPGQAAKGMKGQLGVTVATTTPATTTPKGSSPPTPSTPATPEPPLTGAAAAGALLFDNLGCSSCHSAAQAKAAGGVTAGLNATHSGGPFANGPLTAQQLDDLAAFLNR